MTAAVAIGILGVVGRVFLILLLVIAALIILLLFFPFSYRVAVRKEEGDTEVYARVSWLFSLLRFRVKAKFGKDKKLRPDTELYLIGIPVLSLRRKRREGRVDKKTRNKSKTGNHSAVRGGEEYTGAKIRPSVAPRAERTRPDETKEERPKLKTEIFHRKGPNFFVRFGARISSVIGKIRRFFARLKDVFSRLGEILRFLRSEQFSRGGRALKREVFAMLKHVRPRVVKGRVAFGFDDPSVTGRMLAGLGVLYPILPKKLAIEPDFEEKKLEADILAGGSFFGIVLLVRALRIFLNKDIRAVFVRFGKKKQKTKDQTEKEKTRKAG